MDLLFFLILKKIKKKNQIRSVDRADEEEEGGGGSPE
jgi:hypothetical protein